MNKIDKNGSIDSQIEDVHTDSLDAQSVNSI